MEKWKAIQFYSINLVFREAFQDWLLLEIINSAFEVKAGWWVLKIFQQTAGLIRSAELRSQVYDWSISMGWPSNFNTLFLFGSQFQSWYQSIEKKFDSNIDSQVSLTTNHKCQLYNPSRNHICKRRKSFCVNQMLFMLCSISMV